MPATKGKVTFADTVANQRTTRKKKPAAGNTPLLQSIISGMQDVKAHEIVVLDLRKIAHAMADFFVICSGNSNTQVKAIAQSVEKGTTKELGDTPWHVEGLTNAQWVLLDYVNIVVHVFGKESREFYGLEELWADADVQEIKD